MPLLGTIFRKFFGKLEPLATAEGPERCRRTIDTCVTWLRVIRSTSRSFGLLRYSSMYLISLNVVWIVVALTPDLALWLVPDR